ncbi:MAG: signal recognition particle protein [Deltaproteobacteria bacterium]|nr:signal recognition particle protein [Deltaproteobacteria bacterium]
MFESLTEKLNGIFKILRGRGTLDSETVSAAMKDIRMALLEADVNFKVAKKFIAEVTERSIGTQVLDSISPGQQVVKIVHEELVNLMGSQGSRLDLEGRFPAPVMIVGLQGSGKTTTAAKLAKHLTTQGRKVSMVSTDIHRPAAREQLKILGEKTGTYVHCDDRGDNPVAIAKKALEEARLQGYDTLIVDTAGRLHVDEELMQELAQMKGVLNPPEILLVADAMTGQDAVSVAQAFDSRVSITGVILTKMDGDARGGAALSLRQVTGKPIKYIGVGEKTDALEVFHPERMASRILGMGDILSLVEKAQQSVDERTARRIETRIRKDGLTLDDLKEQILQIRKMGSLREILDMLPGMGQMKALKSLSLDEGEFVKTVAIIDSMTRAERQNARIIDGRRRIRIARGSGTDVQDVNRLLKNYEQMKKMMKKMTKGGMKTLSRGRLPF